MKKSSPQEKRRYVSPSRKSAAEGSKQHVVAVAIRLLSEANRPVSLEAVAQAAGLTRLTVYNQFGSRRGLLEAVFDQCAHDAGPSRLPEVMSKPDPHAALELLIEIYCRFWSSSSALAGLHAAASIDAEFAEALAERNERRRTTIGILVGRMVKQKSVKPRAAHDLIDLLFALTSYPMYRLLGAAGRDADAVCAMLKRFCGCILQVDPDRAVARTKAEE